MLDRHQLLRLLNMGEASYAVQHTRRSGKPLWRTSRSIALTIDRESTNDAAMPAIAAAFEAWETATAHCDGAVFELATGSNGDVRIRSDRWCPDEGNCYDPSIAAITHLRFVDDPDDPLDGKILGTQVELNAVTFELLLPGASPRTTKPALDLQAVLAHEAGHVIGLDHDCATGAGPVPTDEAGRAVPACNADPRVTAATMFVEIRPGELGARSPEPDDIAGACALADRVTPEITAGCSTGAGAGLPLVVLIACWIWRRSR